MFFYKYVYSNLPDEYPKNEISFAAESGATMNKTHKNTRKSPFVYK
jgi:hypothetical protein